MDDFGFDYIEGGWPGSNPRDMQFFDMAREIDFHHAKLAAFGAGAVSSTNNGCCVGCVGCLTGVSG